MTSVRTDLTNDAEERWRQSHLVVTSALAWCIGYLEGLGHDVKDRAFIKQAMEPKFVLEHIQRDFGGVR